MIKYRKIINMSLVTYTISIYQKKRKCQYDTDTNMSISTIYQPGPDLRGARGWGSKPPTDRGPPTKPFVFYFSLMMVVYETKLRLSSYARMSVCETRICSARQFHRPVHCFSRPMPTSL